MNNLLERVRHQGKGNWNEAITSLTSLLTNEQPNPYLTNMAPPSQKKDRFTDLILYFDIVHIQSMNNRIDHSVPESSFIRCCAEFGRVRTERTRRIGIYSSNLLPVPLLRLAHR